jgi:PKD repeat protein
MRPTQWRSLSLTLAVTAVIAACGKDSNDPDPDGNNAAPAADFSSSCAGLSCTFTDLSVDSDGQIASYSWDFAGEGGSSQRNPTHTFAQDGDVSVTLTVTDDAGAEDAAVRTVTVTLPAVGGPAADFSVSCSSLDCTFQDLSTHPDGTIVSWAWEFGDGETSDVQTPPVHHYDVTALTQFEASLTVTDNDGLTSTKTVTFTVSPSASLTCNGVACVLTLEDDAVVTVTLESRECTARNNTFRITEPAEEVLITDGCYSPAVGFTWDLNGGNAYVAGTELNAEVISGSLKQEVAPALRVLGAYPEWTLEFDDGEDATPPEPDFNDLVLTITATPLP